MGRGRGRVWRVTYRGIRGGEAGGAQGRGNNGRDWGGEPQGRERTWLGMAPRLHADHFFLHARMVGSLKAVVGLHYSLAKRHLTTDKTCFCTLFCHARLMIAGHSFHLN